MYGLVNKAIQDLVVENYGEQTWQKIKQKAGFSDEFFISMKSYPDDITYNLVQSTSEVTGMDAHKVLEAFGEYWVLFTAEEGYRDILNIYGSNLKEFLLNLNLLHDQVSLLMPDLNPPKFIVDEISENEIELQYISDREGLVPMVEGLLTGLGKKFNVAVSVKHIKAKADHGHDVFSVVWS